MGGIQITIAEDKLAAWITVKARGSVFPGETELYQAIREAGVVHGIDKEVVKRIAVKRQAVSELQFARGTPPVPGKDARLVWYVELRSPSKPTITKSGKVDFKELNQFAHVNKGDELVSKLPATEGTPGRTVTGEVIQMPGRDVALPAGKNTQISEDGLTLYATADGYVFGDTREVHIDSVCCIKGDVNFSTGNVKFDGKILISGDVRSGFRVDATDSIYIEGNVEAANVYSQNGDIVIERGILGRGRAKVFAGGNLLCGFIQDAVVGVKRDVMIDRYAINSTVSSGGKIVLNSYEGLIRGGKTFAGDGIEANEIGSVQKLSTEIGITYSDSQTSDSERRDLHSTVEELRQKLSVLEKRIAFFRLLEDRLKRLSDEKRREMKAAMQKADEIESQIKMILEQANTGKNQAADEKRSKAIIVREQLHRGVTITIGDRQLYTDRQFRGVTIYRAGDTIRVEELPES
jgi:hypothetical protein